MYSPTDEVTDAEELRDILGEVPASQAVKAIDHIDSHCRMWIERSPFIVISSANSAGEIGVSPKGDPSGFVKVLDKNTLAIPDRPGNRRVDTMHNLLENPQLGILFVVPRRGEVLRVRGTGKIARDTALLDTMAVNNRRPVLAIVVRVHSAMFHCGKAMIRSNMWRHQHWPPIEGLPSYTEALMDHAKPRLTLEEMEARVVSNETNRLYDDKPF